jgi:hypothetical protein
VILDSLLRVPDSLPGIPDSLLRIPDSLLRIPDSLLGIPDKVSDVGRNVEGERSLVYCERRNTRETEVVGVGIEPLTMGKIKWERVPTLPAVLLVAAN